jgi:predicted acylesterase/phospholipase RssA
MENDIIKTLILSGGGVKGFSYIGVFKKLIELKKLDNLEHIIGVSIGSVFGLLYLVGYSYEELYEEFYNKNLNELVDYKLSNFIKKYGFETGKIFMGWLETLLLKKGISNKITFSELFKKTNIKYSVIATNLNLYKLKVFNHETNGKMKVFKAIRMSISLPLILTKQNYKKDIYVDGGVINNIPMELADKDFPNILGINLKLIENENEPRRDIDSIDKYMYHVCNCFFRFKSKIDIKYCEKVIDINICNIETFNWNINEEQKLYLIECGYENTSKYFNEINEIKNN